MVNNLTDVFSSLHSWQLPHVSFMAGLRTALHCTALHCTALHCTALHCTALHCTTLHCTALHYNAMQCNAMQCNTMHCTQLSQHTWNYPLHTKHCTLMLQLISLEVFLPPEVGAMSALFLFSIEVFNDVFLFPLKYCLNLQCHVVCGVLFLQWSFCWKVNFLQWRVKIFF